MKIFTTFIFSIIFSLIVNCQENILDKKTIVYNKHKNEIGIDFQNIFRSNIGIGSSLIYKRRFGEKKFISVNEKKALRFKIGGFGGIPLKGSTSDIDSTSGDILRYLNQESIQLHFLTGVEWQKQKSRVQYFFGVETGMIYSKTNRVISITYSGVPLSLTSYSIEHSNSYSIPVIGFGGVKFFFSPEFSLSIESSLEVSYFFGNIDRTTYFVQTDSSYEFDKVKKGEINFYFDYLNSLNFSYYF